MVAIKLGLMLSAAAFMGAACGGGSSPQCTGHACTLTTFTGELGEMRYENFLLPDGSLFGSVVAFFYKNQTPALQKFPAIPGCTHYADGHFFPLATGAASSPPNSFVLERQYMDVGDTITAQAEKGPAVVLFKQQNFTDTLGRVSPIGYGPQASSPVDGLGGPSNEQVTLAITIPGTAQFAGRTFVGGIGSASPTVSIPPRPDMLSPQLSSLQNTPTNPAKIEIARDKDFELSWTPISNGDKARTFFAFFDANGLDTLCIQDNHMSGRFVVPQSDVTRLPAAGALFVGNFYHQFQNVNGDRLDMIGSACRSAQYTLK